MSTTVIIVAIIAVVIFLAFSVRGGSEQSQPRPSSTNGGRPDAGTRSETNAEFRMLQYPEPTPIFLPEFQSVSGELHKVRSRSEKGVFYDVDLVNLTCSCPGFQKHRSDLPPRDIRRVDKHIFHLLVKNGAIDELDEKLQVLLGYERNSRDSSSQFAGIGADFVHVMTLPSGIQVAVTYSPDNPWINVFSPRRKKGDVNGYYTGSYSRYGYNLVQKRWSYGSPPPGATEIRSELDSRFTFDA